MFNPNLDTGTAWQSVGATKSPTGQFGYLYRVNLDFRSDAALVAVTMSDSTRDWKLAGHIIQLWEQDGFTYQTTYQAVRLEAKTIVPIEPLEESILIFTPVDWLANWTIDIKARPYTPPTQTDPELSIRLANISLQLAALREKLNDCCKSEGISANSTEGRFFTTN